MIVVHVGDTAGLERLFGELEIVSCRIKRLEVGLRAESFRALDLERCHTDYITHSTDRLVPLVSHAASRVVLTVVEITHLTNDLRDTFHLLSLLLVIHVCNP